MVYVISWRRSSRVHQLVSLYPRNMTETLKFWNSSLCRFLFCFTSCRPSILKPLNRKLHLGGQQHSGLLLGKYHHLVILYRLCSLLNRFFQENVGKVTTNRPWLFPSTSFPIHYSIIITRLFAISSELLKSSLNKKYVWNFLSGLLFEWKVSIHAYRKQKLKL
jgi:hypothetical protein